MARPLPDAVLDRIADLASDPRKSAAAIHRAVTTGDDALSVSYPAVSRLVRSMREGDPETAAGMAERMMRLLDRELERLERSTEATDLSRLDQIAATLRRLEPIRPKAGEKRASSLQRFIEDQQPEGLRANGSEASEAATAEGRDNVASGQRR